MVKTRGNFILCVILVIYFKCASAYTVPKTGKCSIIDEGCQIDFYGGVVQETAESGIPDLDIPVLDPYVYKNLELTPMDLITIKSPEVIIKGLKSCQITKYQTNMNKKVITSAFNCKLITVEGKYHVETTPVLNAITTNIKIRGDGFATVKIANLVVESNIPFVIKKLSDGELHFVIQGDEIIFKFDILGKVSATLDNLFIGNQDISALATSIINRNWKFLMNTYPDKILRLGVNIFTENANKFYRAFSVKDLYIENLSAYATQ